MVARGRLGHGGKASVVPRKFARLDDDATHGGAVSANEFGRRVNADGRAPLQGLAQIGTGKGVVYKKWHTSLVAQLSHGFDVQHVQRGVAHGLGIHRLGLRRDGSCKIFGIGTVDKGRVNAQLFEVHTKLCMRAAIKCASCHDVVAGLAYVEQRNHLCSHAAAGCNCCSATL